MRKPPGYWTIKRSKLAAEKCKSKSEFARRFAGAVRALEIAGQYESACKHMKRPAPRVKWTLAKLRRTAGRFKTRKAFKQAFPGAVSRARQLGVMDEICEHMKRLGNRYARFIYEVFDFPYIYVGLSYNTEMRFSDHLRNATEQTRKLFARQTKTEIISGPYEPDVAARIEIDLIAKYRRQTDWIVTNKHKGGGLGSLHRVWSKKAVAKVMRGKTLKQILKKNEGAYQYAKNSPDREYLFGLIKWARRRGANGEKTIFDFESLLSICKGKTQAELQREDSSAFNALQRHERKDEIKKVMKFSPGGRLKWNDEAIEKEVTGKYSNEIAAGALDRIGTHPRKEYFRSLMKYKKERWTFENLCAKARGLTVAEFETKWPGGYEALSKHPRKAEVLRLMRIKQPNKIRPPRPKRIRNRRN